MKRRFSTRLFRAFAVIAAAFVPLTALAAESPEHLKLAGKDTWDLFTYGNGEALAEILASVALMIAPDHGGGAYRYLLLLMATVGFMIMAVKAGFNPAQNFTKMFGFILLIFFVQYGTTGARVNVHVYDRDMNFSQVVPNVPAIVGIPNTIISQVGEWLTTQIEQNFSIPGSLKVSGKGQFNLFGKVMSDLDKFTITDPNLKKSVTAYVTDCVVPAMAMGKVSANDLLNSKQLVETLKRAQHNAIMTRYFPANTDPNTGAPPAGTCAALSEVGTYASNLGALMSCSKAYSCVEADLETYASALMEASSNAWSSTGVITGYEVVMSDALGRAGMSGAPQGVITQKALISSMSGAFRGAATQVGNSELMTATAIAQAEQSQKSAWWTGAEIFKNMMGYVYLVLQAFIFAIVPIVLVGLLIPGLGGKIFVNYFQIMVWLTLWMPMLALVSFLITLFGGAQMKGTLEVAGLSMQTSGVVSEYANNLVIAAQFLATMVPLITWGLVKGAMAFTEFISHGIGSSFASTAGAQAATGNVSMGNLSMDNIGLNKYSTTMSSSVGTQAVQADFGTGMANASFDRGGVSQKAAGQNETLVTQRTGKYAITDGQSFSEGMSKEQATQRVTNLQKSAAESSSLSQDVSHQIGDARSLMTSEGFSTAEGRTVREEIASKSAALAEANRQLSFATDATVTAGLSLDVGGKASVKLASQKAHVEKLSQDLSATTARAHSIESKLSSDASSNHSNTDQRSQNEAAQTAKRMEESYSLSRQASEATKAAEGFSHNFGVTEEKSMTRTNSEAESATGHLGSSMGAIDAEVAAGGSAMSAHRERMEALRTASGGQEVWEGANGGMTSTGAEIGLGSAALHSAAPASGSNADTASRIETGAHDLRVGDAGDADWSNRAETIGRRMTDDSILRLDQSPMTERHSEAPDGYNGGASGAW